MKRMESNWDEFVREQEAKPEMRPLLDLWRTRYQPGYVPLSVREARRFSRKRFGWWLKGRREALALRLAPWLSRSATEGPQDG